MEQNKQQLMKYFASVLRNQALGKQTDNLMSKNLSFYFTRKQLIEMVTKHFNGSIPKEHNLVELENKELLELIDNKLFIISYVTGLWSTEPPQVKQEKDKPKETPKPEKPKGNDKKDKTSAKS